MKILKSKIILMKNSLKTKSLAVALMLFFSLVSYAYAGFYEDVMAQVDDDFEKSGDKFAVISRPMDFDYMVKYYQSKDSTKVDFKQLYGRPNLGVMRRTNALALAICEADYKRVEKFLKVVENPNDSTLWVQGYRQPYNLVSLSADPEMYFQKPQTLQDRLKIIDLLATTTADFNFVPENSIYTNPPLLAATALHGRRCSIFKEEDYHSCQESVQARLMLYGADPKIDGSTSRGVANSYEFNLLMDTTFQQLMDTKLNDIRPTPYVKGLLLKMIEKESKELEKESKELDKLLRD